MQLTCSTKCPKELHSLQSSTPLIKNLENGFPHIQPCSVLKRPLPSSSPPHQSHRKSSQNQNLHAREASFTLHHKQLSERPRRTLRIRPSSHPPAFSPPSPLAAITKAVARSAARLLPPASRHRTPMIDCLASAKAFVFDMQSALRRRGDKAHVCSKRKARKEAVTCSKLLKKMEERFVFAALVERNGDMVMLDGLMREAREITVVVLRLLVSVVEIPSSGRKDWCKRMFFGGSKVVGLELLLSAAFEQVLGGGDGWEKLEEKVHEELSQVESGIGGLEIGLQCLFRRMIQNRVVLLNLISF